jgi:hypothetical protein
MTDQQRPTITPPPELMQQWREQAPRHCGSDAEREERLIERAAQWGYDQRGEVNEAKLQKVRDEELEACCKCIYDQGWFANPEHRIAQLRAARRPKPPSLKEQALSLINESANFHSDYLDDNDLSTIRRALEALPND